MTLPAPLRPVCPARFLIALLIVLLLLCLPGVRLSAQDGSVEIDTVRTRVRPQLEFSLPSGEVRQRSTIPVGESAFTVRSDLNPFTGSLSGGLRIARRIDEFEPYLDLGLDLQTETPLAAEASELFAEIDVEEMFERDRLATIGARWSRLPGRIEGAVEVRERVLFRASEEALSSIDVTPLLAWESSNVRRLLPGRTPETVGGYGRVEVTHLANVDSMSAVDLRLRVSGLINYRPGDRWRAQHRLQAFTPLIIWNRRLSRSVGFGGFDAVRGHPADDTVANRGLISSNVVSREITTSGDGSDPIESLTVHSVRALALFDFGVYQSAFSIDEPLGAIAGGGGGLALTVSAPGGIHFDLEAYLAAPLDQAPMPVIYIRTAVFSLSTAGVSGGE
jgi:hypothetical protein